MIGGAFALALGLATSQAFAAEATIATGPTALQAPAQAGPWLRFSVKADGGVALVPGHTVGGYARLGADFALTEDPERARLVWGFWEAYEGWLGNDAGGFAIPIVFFAGFRAPPVVATLGAGLNALTIDRLDDDTGVGVLSPRADLRLGLDFGGVFVLATSDVQRRWMWGRDDITLLQAGLALGVGPPFRRPETARR